MNRKNKAILAVLMVSCLLLSACSAKSAPYDPAAAPAEYYTSQATEQVAAAPAEVAAADSIMMDSAAEMEEMGGQPPALADRKIIKNSYLILESKEFDSAIPQIIALVDGAGGYIESQSSNGRSLTYGDSYYERNATIVARVPAEKLEELTTGVSALCNVVSRSEGMDDITDVYFDAQAHLDSLKLQEERLLEILSKAEKLEDVVSLETALGEVRYQIESLTSQLKRMDTQVAYSTLTMELREVVEYQNITTAPKSFGEKFSAAAGRSVGHVIDSMQSLILLAVEAGPVLLLWLIIVLLVILIIRAIYRRLRKTRLMSPQPPKQSPVISVPSAETTEQPAENPSSDKE